MDFKQIQDVARNAFIEHIDRRVIQTKENLKAHKEQFCQNDPERLRYTEEHGYLYLSLMHLAKKAAEADEMVLAMILDELVDINIKGKYSNIEQQVAGFALLMSANTTVQTTSEMTRDFVDDLTKPPGTTIH